MGIMVSAIQMMDHDVERIVVYMVTKFRKEEAKARSNYCRVIGDLKLMHYYAYNNAVENKKLYYEHIFLFMLYGGVWVSDEESGSHIEMGLYPNHLLYRALDWNRVNAVVNIQRIIRGHLVRHCGFGSKPFTLNMDDFPPLRISTQ